MSSPRLKHMVPAALLCAVVIVLTFGATVAQAALVRGRGVSQGPLPALHTGTNAGIVIVTIALLAFVTALVVSAVVGGRRADRRESAVASAANRQTGEPERLPGAQTETESEQARKAA